MQDLQGFVVRAMILHSRKNFEGLRKGLNYYK